MAFEYGDFKLNLLDDKGFMKKITDSILSFVWSLDAKTRDAVFDDYVYNDGDLTYLGGNNKKLNFKLMFQRLESEIIKSNMMKVTRNIIEFIEKELIDIKRIEEQQNNQLELLDFID